MIFNMLLLQLNTYHRTCLCTDAVFEFWTDAVFGPHEYDAMMHVPGSPYTPDAQGSHEAPVTPMYMITLLMK